MASPPIAGWQTLAKSKRDAVAAKIPSDWLLPSSLTSSFSETSSTNVLSVPSQCGLLSARVRGRATHYSLAEPELTRLLLGTAESLLAATGEAVALCPTVGGAQIVPDQEPAAR